MFSIKMITFCKNVNCPSSEDLLTFQNNKVPTKDISRIEAHLAVCEFCTSEVEFYAHYPPSEEPLTTAEIPFPLFELASAILNNKHSDYSILNDLLSENDEIKV